LPERRFWPKQSRLERRLPVSGTVENHRNEKDRNYKIAVIPGDGIGKEVVPEGVRVLEVAAREYGFKLQFDEFDFASCDYYLRHSKMLSIGY
jgi:isocitrate dehydrogenase